MVTPAWRIVGLPARRHVVVLWLRKNMRAVGSVGRLQCSGTESGTQSIMQTYYGIIQGLDLKVPGRRFRIVVICCPKTWQGCYSDYCFNFALHQAKRNLLSVGGSFPVCAHTLPILVTTLANLPH